MKSDYGPTVSSRMWKCLAILTDNCIGTPCSINCPIQGKWELVCNREDTIVEYGSFRLNNLIDTEMFSHFINPSDLYKELRKHPRMRIVLRTMIEYYNHSVEINKTVKNKDYYESRNIKTLR